jgi:hypothetical protein
MSTPDRVVDRAHTIALRDRARERQAECRGPSRGGGSPRRSRLAPARLEPRPVRRTCAARRAGRARRAACDRPVYMIEQGSTTSPRSSTRRARRPGSSATAMAPTSPSGSPPDAQPGRTHPVRAGAGHPDRRSGDPRRAERRISDGDGWCADAAALERPLLDDGPWPICVRARLGREPGMVETMPRESVPRSHSPGATTTWCSGPAPGRQRRPDWARRWTSMAQSAVPNSRLLELDGQGHLAHHRARSGRRGGHRLRLRPVAVLISAGVELRAEVRAGPPTSSASPHSRATRDRPALAGRASAWRLTQAVRIPGASPARCRT